MRRSFFPVGILAISLIGSTAMALRYRAAISTADIGEASPSSRKISSYSSPDPTVSQASPALRDERESRLRAIISQVDPLARTRALLLLVGSLGSQDFASLLDVCRASHLTADADVCRLLLTAWVNLDPAAALDYAAADSSALKIIAGAWSARDPQAAFDWVDRHATGKLANQLLPLVLPGVTAGRPESAAAKLAGLDEETRKTALPGITAEIMKSGDAGIESWLDSFAEGRPRREALAAVVENLSIEHPEEMLRWMKKYPGSLADHFPTIGATALFSAWSDRDFPAAQGAFAALDPGTAVHREALQGMIEGREMRQNPAAIGALLNQYPDELDYFILYRAMALTHDQDPLVALDLVARMPPRTTDLDEYYGLILGEWMVKDAAAATAWLGSHQVPASVRQSFEKK